MAAEVPRPVSSTPLRIKTAVDKVVQQLRRPIIFRAYTHQEGRLVRIFLDEAKIDQKEVDILFNELRKEDLLAEFFQLAHPRWGNFVRDWLKERGVPWSTIHAYYEYDARDSADFFIGFLTGMGVSLVDLPILLGKLTKTFIDGKLAEETRKFFDAVVELWSRDLKAFLEEIAEKWIADLDEHIYKLEWFEAGYQLGYMVTSIVLFGKGAAKAAASLPRFVKLAPLAARETAALTRRLAHRVIRTARDASLLLRAIGGRLYLLPDLRYSLLLPSIISPGELRLLMSGKNFRITTSSGFDVIYLEGARDTVTLGVTLGGGPVPTGFVSESALYIIRRDGQAVARVHDPKSLAHAWKDVADFDREGAFNVLADDAPSWIPPQSPEMQALVKRAAESTKFADDAASLNLRVLSEEFVEVVDREKSLLTASGAVRPTAAVFGTKIESAMKPVLDRLADRHAHLLFFRKRKMRELIGGHLPPRSRVLEITVEDYIQYNRMLAQEVGYNGVNITDVMAASPKTIIGNLEVDFFVMDPFGHQGFLLDFTSFYSVAHWNKGKLYHAVIVEAFPNMRLPLCEMYHFGLDK
jgi:hypothetical protein